MDAILREFPDCFESERLTIRCPRPGDGPELNRAVLESWEELRQWMPWADKKPAVEESEANVRQAHLEFMARRDMRLSLFLKGSQTMVGSSGLHRISWEVPSFEIGYWVRTPYAGRGFITEAVAAISDFAFETLGARRVEIRCDARNERSAAVARRLHFALEARLRNESRHHLSGEVRDTLVFALIWD
ncbi:MAG: GNAT family N-acetyltransferase [Candidatus Promineifilaceae bacterium]